MKENLIISVRLDAPTHKKLKEFAIINHISLSEIFKVLIEKSNIKLKNVRLNGNVIWEARLKGKVNKSQVRVNATEDTISKLNKLRIENNASCSEIIRCLINEADFSKYKFKTIGEIYKEAIKKNKEKVSK